MKSLEQPVPTNGCEEGGFLFKSAAVRDLNGNSQSPTAFFHNNFHNFVKNPMLKMLFLMRRSKSMNLEGHGRQLTWFSTNRFNSLSPFFGSFQQYGYPQIIHLFIGFSIIFTIHFGGFPPIFGNTHIWLHSQVEKQYTI